MHRPGIEPGPPAWQASILPLNQRCLDTLFFNNEPIFTPVMRKKEETITEKIENSFSPSGN